MRHALHQSLWILRFRARAALRYLGANAFVLAVLGPVIIGTLFLIVDRGVLLLRQTVRDLTMTADGATPGPVFLALALLFTALALGAAFDELYPKRDPRALLDVLPVTPVARFVVAWLACLTTNGLAWAGLALAASLLGEHGPALPPLDVLVRLAAVFLPLVGVQLIAVLVAVRARLFRAGPVLAVVAVLALVVVFAPRQPLLASVVLAPWWAAAGQMNHAFGQLLAPENATVGVNAARWPVLLLSTLVSAGVAGVLMTRWQRRDRSRAHALQMLGRGAFGRRLARVLTWLGRPIAAQVVRDVLLVVRRFSPIVYVAATLTLLANAVVVAVLPDGGATPFWHGRLALLGVVTGVLAQVAIVPFVLRHELPRFWFERTAGVAAPQVWRAKLWLARLLALPPVVLGGFALLTVPQTPSAFGVALLELLLAAWVVSSLIGAATFEIADRPLLGLVFSALVALALATLMILYRSFLPFWLIAYFIVAGSIGERATHRVRFTEVIR